MPQEPTVNLSELILHALSTLDVFANALLIMLVFFFLLTAKHIDLPIKNREAERLLVHLIGIVLGLLFIFLVLILVGTLSAAGEGGKIIALVLWCLCSGGMLLYILARK